MLEPSTAHTQVYVMGKTDLLGFRHESRVIERPKLVSYSIQIEQIATSDTHTHILSTQGRVYSMGSNVECALGLGLNEASLRHQQTPQLIKSIERIKQIAVGKHHSLALDQDGRVYGWGGSPALGLRQKDSSAYPQQIQLGAKKITQIACGEHHSMLLVLGNVWAIGLNEQGQLGIGERSIQELRPVQTLIQNVTKISCGSLHTHFLTSEGLVYGCGYNLHGQVGDGQQSDQYTPSKLSLSKIVEIASGETSYALNKDGDLFAWGKNYKTITKVLTKSGLVSVQQSQYGFTAGVDSGSRLWVWCDYDNSSFDSKPKPMHCLRKRRVTKVFVGRNSLFGLGEDIYPDMSITSIPQAQNVLIDRSYDSSHTRKISEITRPLTDHSVNDLEQQIQTLKKQLKQEREEKRELQQMNEVLRNQNICLKNELLQYEGLQEQYDVVVRQLKKQQMLHPVQSKLEIQVSPEEFNETISTKQSKGSLVQSFESRKRTVTSLIRQAKLLKNKRVKVSPLRTNPRSHSSFSSQSRNHSRKLSSHKSSSSYLERNIKIQPLRDRSQKHIHRSPSQSQSLKSFKQSPSTKHSIMSPPNQALFSPSQQSSYSLAHQTQQSSISQSQQTPYQAVIIEESIESTLTQL